MQTNFLSIDGEDQINVTLEAQLGFLLASLVLILMKTSNLPKDVLEIKNIFVLLYTSQ